MNQSTDISTLVRNVLPELQDPPVKPSLQQSLVDFWMHNVGALATNYYPILFESGRMVVMCKSAVWTTQLRNMVPSLIRQLNEANFNVGIIEVKTSPGAIHYKPAIRNYPKAKTMSRSNAEEMDSLSDKLTHSALSLSLKRLAARHQKASPTKPRS